MDGVDVPDAREIEAYLDRIGFRGTVRPDLATLGELHRRHLGSISYDALDIPLGRRVTLDPRDAFRKIVVERRGGWCYEMNGLFGWILEAIGFDVTRVGATVMREEGQPGRGDHLVLIVRLDGQRYVADVGFGEGPQLPFRLAPARFEQQGIEYRLERLASGWWRLRNETQPEAPWFDFRARPASERTLAAMNWRLQHDPASPFVLNAVVARATDDGVVLLRGRVLRTLTGPTYRDHRIDTPEEYTAVLRRTFDLEVPGAASLWPRILERHERLFGAEQARARSATRRKMRTSPGGAGA